MPLLLPYQIPDGVIADVDTADDAPEPGPDPIPSMMLPRGSKKAVVLGESDREPDDDGLFTTIIAALDSVGKYHRDIDFSKLDVGFYATNPVVLYSHERWEAKAVVAKTERLQWETDGLRAWFRFVEGNEVADVIRRSWEQRALNAASVTVYPTEDGRERLMEWSIVPVPADMLAVSRSDLSPEAKKLFYGNMKSKPDANIEKLTKAIDAFNKSLKEMRESFDASLKETRDKMDAKIDEKFETIEASVKELLTERDERVAAEKARADKAKVDADAAAKAEPKVEPEPAGRADEPNANDSRTSEPNLVGAAKIAAKYRNLIPDEFTITDTTTAREIMLVAAGMEIKDKGSRSDAYLEARLDGILERRAANGAKRNTKVDTSASSSRVSANDLPKSISDLVKLVKES